MPEDSPAYSLSRDVSLSRALTMLIDDIESRKSDQNSLRLFARRFVRQQVNWQATNEIHLEENVIEFIHQYILYLPVVVEEFELNCRKLHWFEISSQITKILSSFFEDTQSQQLNVGVLGILDKAYFGHRLIEEMHDHMMCLYGSPVLAWNMTSANLLVHNLLGDHYCSKLDSTVIELTEKLINKAPSQNISPLRQSTQSWPCFCNHFAVGLCL